MPGTEWQSYPALSGSPAAADTLLLLQKSDHSASSSGTVHQVTAGNFQVLVPPSGDVTGATDVTNINAVISAGGCAVLAWTGTAAPYYLNAPLTPASGATLRGATPWAASQIDYYGAGNGGQGGTVLHVVSGFSGAAVISMSNTTATQYYGVSLLDFTLDAFDAPTGHGILVHGAWGAGIMRGVCVNAPFTDCLHFEADATHSVGPDDWRVEGCKFSYSGGYGVYADNLPDSTFSDCEASACGNDNWYLAFSLNTRLIGCKGEGSTGGAGFHFPGQGGADCALSLTGCTTHANHGDGFLFDGTASGAASGGRYVLAGCYSVSDNQAGGTTFAGYRASGCLNTVTAAACTAYGAYYGASQVSASAGMWFTGSQLTGTGAATHDDGSNTTPLLASGPDYATVAPSGDSTGVTDPGRIQAALSAAGAAVLVPGATYYLGGSSPVTLGAGQSLDGRWATVVIPSGLTAAEVLLLNGTGASVRNLYVHGASGTTTSNPAADAVTVSAATGCRVEDIRALNINGRVVKAAAGSSVSIADLMISRVAARNCAAGVHLLGVTGTSFLGEVFLSDIQLQQAGVTSGANANLDALLVSDIGDVLGNGVNVGMASGVTGSPVHVSGACSTVQLQLDVGTPATTVASVHVDAATGNGTPSDIQLRGSAEGGEYALQVDAGTDVLADMHLHGAYASNLKVSGTPVVTWRGSSAAANQGGGTSYDLDASGMTSGGALLAKGAVFETTVGSAAAGVVPAVAAVTSQCYFSGCTFRGSGSSPSLVFSGTPEAVDGCIGYNPRGSVTAPSVGTSPYTPSASQTALMVIFTAVNGMTAFAIGGTSVGLPAAGVPYTVGVRQSMTVTWTTTAPTWQWFGL